MVTFEGRRVNTLRQRKEHDMELEHIGERMRQARRDAGLSQGQLGERINTTQSAISLYESESRSIGLATVDAVCEATGASLEYMLGTSETYFTVRRNSDAGRLVALVETQPETVKELWDFAHFLQWREGPTLVRTTKAG